MEARVNENMAQIDAATRHLNDINAYTKVNLDRQTKDLSLRHAQILHPPEYATFPIAMIPRQKNLNFYGRTEELQKIDNFLAHGGTSYRTYTIYGRRGVGKTDIALEYAHNNPSKFEAIFWINCETSVSLRGSFNDIAVALNEPGADRNGNNSTSQTFGNMLIVKAVMRKINWQC